MFFCYPQNRSTQVLAWTGIAALPVGAQITVTSPEPDMRHIRGVVVDADTGQPIDGIYVLAQSTQSLARSDEDGNFQLFLPEGPQRLVLTRIGYGEFEAVVDPEDEDERVRIEAVPVPTELPGLEVEARSFQVRLDSISEVLSQRARGRRWQGGRRGAARGVPRFASIEKIRQYDDVDDPVFAIRSLGVWPDLMGVEFCAFRSFGQRIEPTFIIDGDRLDFRGCDRFRELNVGQICRMEAIPFDRDRRADPRGRLNYDLYVWTCGFMARLAAGDEEIPEIFDVLVPVWGGIGN